MVEWDWADVWEVLISEEMLMTREIKCNYVTFLVENVTVLKVVERVGAMEVAESVRAMEMVLTRFT